MARRKGDGFTASWLWSHGLGHNERCGTCRVPYLQHATRPHGCGRTVSVRAAASRTSACRHCPAAQCLQTSPNTPPCRHCSAACGLMLAWRLRGAAGPEAGQQVKEAGGGGKRRRRQRSHFFHLRTGSYFLAGGRARSRWRSHWSQYCRRSDAQARTRSGWPCKTASACSSL